MHHVLHPSQSDLIDQTVKIQHFLFLPQYVPDYFLQASTVHISPVHLNQNDKSPVHCESVKKLVQSSVVSMQFLAQESTLVCLALSIPSQAADKLQFCLSLLLHVKDTPHPLYP